MMTRKDYVETARILNKYKTTIDEKDFTDLVDDFAFMFEKDNPRFVTDKFIEAVNNDNEQTNNITCTTNAMGTNSFWYLPSNQRTKENGKEMILDNGTLIAIVIALAGSLGMMIAFWNRNVQLEKEIRRLQIALRTERIKK